MLGSVRADASARRGALDLHEGIDDPLGSKPGCKRWPEPLRLLNATTGELVPGRCRATNLCDYCARLFAVETSEMLLLDAMEDSPSVYVVLTARELLDRSDCRRHLLQLRRSLRKRWPSIRWAVLVEFQRRGALHLNLLVKGVPVEDVEELHERASALWCSRVDAEPQAQFVGRVNDGAGLVRYISLHFLKPGQAPPAGWRGHRYSATRDYLVRPAAEMRVEARRSLRLKRLLHRGVPVELAELELEQQEQHEWRLWGHTSRNPDVERAEQARAPFRSILPRSRSRGGDRVGSTFTTSGLQPGSVREEEREESGSRLRRGTRRSGLRAALW